MLQTRCKTLLSCVLACVVIVGCHPEAADQSPRKLAGFYETPKEFKDALARLKIKRDKIAESQMHLETRKQETVKLLKEQGVSSTAEAQKSDSTRLTIKLLESLVEQIKRLENDIKRYDQAIIRIEAKLKDLEIQQLTDEVGLSDQEFMELSRTIHDLDDQMGISNPSLLDELELEQLLEAELGSDPVEGKDKNQPEDTE